MQFLTNGPDIPTELLHAQERGEAVFICGAGVSRTVGLPSFHKLTKDIYEALHESWATHPAEAEGMIETNLTLDRTLFALQMRLAGSDARRAAQVRQQVIAAVQKSLQPPDVNLAHHLNILRLSRDIELRPRVVTTNFDTLFERAWNDSRQFKIRSFAAAEMPAPGSADFEGVLHLHGRIEDKKLELHRSDLVLTSAEFGEAYLRSGWAARYVYDLARSSTIVIVGYGVDDPPMRYLLEVLTADRSRFTDLKSIYAFVPCDADEASQAKQIDLWKVRGTTPILYSHGDGNDHSGLYDTLAAWSEYAEDPTRWRSERARTLLAGDSGELEDASWGQLIWALSRGDGARILADVNPSPTWLSVLHGRCVIGPNGFSPGRWLVKRLDDQEMLVAVVAHLDIEEELATDINWALEDAHPLSETRKFWRLCLANRSSRAYRWEGRWFGLLKRVERGEFGLDVRRNLALILRPMPVARRAIRWPGDAESKSDHLASRIDVDFQVRDHVEPEMLVVAWPPEHDEALLRSLIRALFDALEDAVEYGFVSAEFDRASRDVNSVAIHQQDRLRDGFYPIVRIIADLISRLGSTNQLAAQSISQELAASSYLLPRRLFLHALSIQSIFSAKQAATDLLNLSDEDFWSWTLRRETMRLMAERWANFSMELRHAIEERIVSGVPNSILSANEGSEGQIKSIQDREIFVRLARLESISPGLSDAGRNEIARIRCQHQNWTPGVGDRDDFSFWSESSIGEQGDLKLLATIPDEQLVSEAIALAKRDPFNQGEVWRKFVRADPARALDGLVAQSKNGEWQSSAWTPYFWALIETDLPDLERRTIDHLSSVPLDQLNGFSHSVSDWLLRRHRSIILACAGSTTGVLSLWDRLAQCIDLDAQKVEALDENVVSAILNEPIGHLTRFLIAELSRRNPVPDSTFQEDLARRFSTLTEFKGRAGMLAHAALVADLPYLHSIDADWTEKHLVPLLSTNGPWMPSMWATFVRNRGLGNLRLWRMIKPVFLNVIGHPALSRETVDGLIDHLIVNMIGRQLKHHGDDAPTWLEAKEALLRCGPEGRRRAAYIFFENIKKAGVGAAHHWRHVMGPIFTAIWPMQTAAQTADTTLYLSWMTQYVGEAFPEAVDAIHAALVSSPRALHPLIDHPTDDNKELYRKFPAAALSLIEALTDRESPSRNLAVRLEDIAVAEPALRHDPRFERLLGIVRRISA